MVSSDVVCDEPEERGECTGGSTGAGAGQLPDGLDVAAQVASRDGRPGRDKLSGWVEVDETYFGGLEEGKTGRGSKDKALIVIAAQADGKAIGRVLWVGSQSILSAVGRLLSWLSDHL